MSADSRATSTLPFFLTAWALATFSLLPAILAQRGVIAGPSEPYMLFAPIAVLSPMLAAMIASRSARSVFRPLRDWRAPARWYAIAFFISPLALLAGTAVYKLAGGQAEVAWWYPPQTPDRIAAMFLIPLGEELGWRGYALPRLVQRFGPRTAALLMGAGWGLWHVPLLLLQGVQLGPLLGVMVLFFLPASVVYTWVFQRTRGLLPVAVFMHVGIHTNNSMMTLPGNAAPFFIHLAALTVLAAVLLAAARRPWAR